MIVGRDSERAVLAEFVARADGPAALLLEGDAGIGKTTLLRDALTHAGERRVLACRPAQAETPLAFAALADLLDGVDLSPLPLTQIERAGDGVRIGAMARNSAVATHPLVVERYPLLAQALLAGASQQVRNMATVGGNICMSLPAGAMNTLGLPAGAGGTKRSNTTAS